MHVVARIRLFPIRNVARSPILLYPHKENKEIHVARTPSLHDIHYATLVWIITYADLVDKFCVRDHNVPVTSPSNNLKVSLGHTQVLQNYSQMSLIFPLNLANRICNVTNKYIVTFIILPRMRNLAIVESKGFLEIPADEISLIKQSNWILFPVPNVTESINVFFNLRTWGIILVMTNEQNSIMITSE